MRILLLLLVLTLLSACGRPTSTIRVPQDTINKAWKLEAQPNPPHFRAPLQVFAFPGELWAGDTLGVSMHAYDKLRN